MTMDRARGSAEQTPARQPRRRAADDPLRERYEQYRRRQAARLVTLLPRDAIRPLYREARARALRRGTFDPQDPVRALMELCLEVLPLPPFQRWHQDLEQNPVAHLEDEAPAGQPRGQPRPTLADTRTLTAVGCLWYASLHLYADDDGWRGFVAFHSPERSGAHRTADIFHESSPADVRERFRSFEPQTLEAFLRSVLP